MFLTKIELRLSDRVARAALTDSQKMHALVTKLFGVQRGEANLLYRIKDCGIVSNLYIYSSQLVQPEALTDGIRLVGQRDISKWCENLTAGTTLHFDVITMPSKKVEAENVKHGRRCVLRTLGEREAWFNRKAEQNGFSVLSLQEMECVHFKVTHPVARGGKFEIEAYHYQGQLLINSSESFQKAVRCGIGPEKAYGLGMLMLSK